MGAIRHRSLRPVVGVDPDIAAWFDAAAQIDEEPWG
jgi:hypothetical protein